MAVTHSKVSAVADGGDTDLVRPSDWNADHDVSLTAADVGAAPDSVDYLVGTASGGLSGEIAVGTTPGGELGGTWASPTVDATHSGSAHVQIAGDLAGTAATPTVASATNAFALLNDETSTLTGAQDDVTLASGTTVFRWNGASTATFTGLTGGADGRIVVLQNVTTAQNLTLSHDVTSTAGNRFFCPNSVSMTVLPNEYVVLVYDATSSRWRVNGEPINTAAGANITIDNAGTTGTAGYAAASGHGHRVNTSSANPVALGSVSAGTSGTAPSRGDHVHPTTGLVTTSTSAGGDLAGTYPDPTVRKASKSFQLTNDESSTLTGAQDNVTLGTDTTVFRWNGASDATFTGMTRGADGDIVVLMNVTTANTLTLSHNVTSTAINRFFLPNSVATTILPNESVILVYDATSQRWRVTGEPNTAGGDLTGTYPNPTVAQAANSFALPNDETSTLTGAQDNVTLGANTAVFRWDGASDATFTGLSGGADGRIVVLMNVTTANTLTLSHDVTSTAGNRFRLPNAVSLALLRNQSVILVYDSTHTRWRVSGEAIDTAAGANDTIDSAGTTGTAGYAAASGHGHRLNTYSSAGAAIGTAAAGTSGTAPSRGDHVHSTGAGTPVTQAFSDVAAIGTGPAAAMTDHKHGMPAGSLNPHGAADHNDITRTIFIPARGFSGTSFTAADTGTAATIGTFPDAALVGALADGATQGHVFMWALPADAKAATAVNIRILWSPGSTDAVSHTVRWSVNALALKAGVTTDAAGTTTAFTGASAARTAKVIVEDTSTQILASTGSGDVLRISLRRVGADAADSYVGVVNVIGIYIDYTATQ